MFENSAELYDAIYRSQGKDYAAEVKQVTGLILERAPEARTLLDVGCASGVHLEYFRERFTCTGLDIGAELLEVARGRFGDTIDFHQGDMADFDLGRQFDAVVCLFSSIGYVCTYERLVSTARVFARHLRPGGVVVVEPWHTPDAWDDKNASILTVIDEENLQGARIFHKTARQGRLTALELHYLVATADDVDYRIERHELGLFSFDEYLEAFRTAGFTVELDREGLIGRGLIIGRLGTSVPTAE